MVLKLVYQAETSLPVEIEGLTPDWACEKSLAEIEQFPIFHGNRKLPLAEMFKVTGDASDKEFEIEGALAGVHWIGAKMSSGTIRILGSAGRHLGSEMSGGTIIVDENAGDFAGVQMHGGLIHVAGNAGNLLGGAYRGSVKGMTGGTIVVHGNAKDEIGLSMRRGLIAVGRNAGDMLGFNMIAGTIFVFGECGIRPGAGMRRGTLGLFGANPPQLLPSFYYATTCRPQVVSIILRTLRDKGFNIDDSLMGAEFDLYHGDLVSLGRGEVMFRRQTVFS